MEFIEWSFRFRAASRAAVRVRGRVGRLSRAGARGSRRASRDPRDGRGVPGVPLRAGVRRRGARRAAPRERGRAGRSLRGGRAHIPPSPNPTDLRIEDSRGNTPRSLIEERDSLGVRPHPLIRGPEALALPSGGDSSSDVTAVCVQIGILWSWPNALQTKGVSGERWSTGPPS